MTDSDLQVRVRRLELRDDRKGFRSGNIDLDRYFQRYAGQNQFRHYVGTTYVAVSASRVVGYVTISSGEIDAETLSRTLRRRLPAYPLPILRIARLAVDERFQGHGIGRLLLRAMLDLALEMRDRVGCIGVVVDAKPDAVAFYAGLGFEPIDHVVSARLEIGRNRFRCSCRCDSSPPVRAPPASASLSRARVVERRQFIHIIYLCRLIS